jgi:hypothetical protein
MKAFGTCNDAGATHYIENGVSEHRSTSFNVGAYDSAHPEVIGKFSSNNAFLAERAARPSKARIGEAAFRQNGYPRLPPKTRVRSATTKLPLMAQPCRRVSVRSPS